MAAFQTYNFEAGSPGSSITTADTPSAGDTQFELVTIGTSSTLAYDSTHTAHGGQSAKLATTSSVSGQCLFGWNTSVGTTTQIWMRSYCYFTGNPPGIMRIAGAFSGGTLGGSVAVSASGKILLIATGGGTVLTGGTTIPAGSWFRLEFMALASATVGQLEYKLFLTPETTAPDETGTTSAAQNTGASFSSYRYGQSTGVTSGLGPTWLDDVAVSTTGYPGPVPTAAPDVTAALPGPAWRARFQPARPRPFISLPGNTQIRDGDTGGASGEDVTGINATQVSSDTGSGDDGGEQQLPSDSDDVAAAEADGTIAFPDSDTGAGSDAGEQLALSDSDTGSGTEAAFAGLRQPELLRAKPGPVWQWHFKPGLTRRKPVISLPDSAVFIQISDGDTFTDNEGAGFPTADADTSAVAAETEQVTVLDADTWTGVTTSSTGLAGSDTGTGAGSDPSTVGFTPPPGVLYVQPVATGFTPKSGSTATLTVNSGVVTTAGNVVVLNCRTFSASHLISVTDSRGNLWQIDSTGGTNGSNISVASAVMGASTFLRDGDTITVTNSTTSINDGSAAPQAGAVEYSGIAVSGGMPVVRLTSVIHTTASPTTVTMASAGASGDLAYTAQAAGVTSSTFTLTGADPSSGGAWADLGIPRTSGAGTDCAAQTASGPSAYSVTWAWTGGGNGTGVIVLYAGSGIAPPGLPGSETAAGDDEQILTVLGSDTGTGTGAASDAAGVADSDTGTGTEASKQGPSDSDTGSGLDVATSNNKASADTGTFAETALAGPVTFPKHDSDTALGQDIGISYVSDSDAAAADELAAALFADSDTFAGDDEEDAGGGPFLIADDDEFAGAEFGGPQRPITDTDTGSGSELVGPFPAVSTETGAGADIEVPAQGVDVWPGIPDSAWRFGRMRVVWREGTPEEVVLAEGPPSGKLFRFQARVQGIYSLTLIRDGDTGAAADAQTPVATVSVAVLATPVAIEIPGTPGPPGMFGYASGFPREET